MEKTKHIVMKIWWQDEVVERGPRFAKTDKNRIKTIDLTGEVNVCITLTTLISLFYIEEFNAKWG